MALADYWKQIRQGRTGGGGWGTGHSPPQTDPFFPGSSQARADIAATKARHARRAGIPRQAPAMGQPPVGLGSGAEGTGGIFSQLQGWLGQAAPYIDAAQIALLIGGGVWDAFTESPREKLEKEIIEARKERLADLKRQVKGDFTPGERLGIRRANEPIMNRIASNLASRGLEASGAAAQLLGQAEQQPFLHAQDRAQGQLDSYELQTFGLMHELVQEDEAFLPKIGNILMAFQQSQQAGEPDPLLAELDNATTKLSEILPALQQLAEE